LATVWLPIPVEVSSDESFTGSDFGFEVVIFELKVSTANCAEDRAGGRSE